MSHLTRSTLEALGVSAAVSAAYLDACDAGARCSPAYYRACGDLLTKILSLEEAGQAFPHLLAHSAAAREIADAIRMRRHIEVGQLKSYPLLAALLKRTAH